MAESLAHRGPHGEGTWLDGPVALGHKLLRTTPESREESQPLLASESRLVLVADARLDNRDQLGSKLGLSRHRVAETPDVKLLLAAYERWGEQCVEHCLGDFAVAVWDQERRALVCLRDPFGVKPVYYVRLPGRLFALASESTALLTLEEVPDEIHDLEIGRHLLIPLGTDKGSTYYKHVRKLMPGHVLKVTQHDLEEWSYWQLDPNREVRFHSDEEYAEALRECFVEAVRCRMRSDTPVSSMLSGGLDSSAIFCVAAGLGDRSKSATVHTLSAIYPSVPESDERNFIDQVLDRYSSVPHFFNAESVHPFAEIDRIHRFVGGATWGGNLYLNWELCGIAEQAGARVVLDGFDGDSTLSDGRAYLTELALSMRWLRLAVVGIPFLRREGRSPIAVYTRLVRAGLRHRFLGARAHRVAEEDTGRVHWSPIIDGDFATEFADRIEPSPDPPTTERGFHAQKLSRQSLLEILGWIEACGSARGVEVRFPFFDVRLVELCLAMPPEQKIRGGWTRSVFRRAMEGILPKRIQWRPTKTDMHHGWEFACRSNRNGRLDDLLSYSDSRVSRYLNVDQLRNLYARFMSRDITASESRILWRAMSLALWLTARES